MRALKFWVAADELEEREALGVQVRGEAAAAASMESGSESSSGSRPGGVLLRSRSIAVARSAVSACASSHSSERVVGRGCRTPGEGSESSEFEGGATASVME